MRPATLQARSPLEPRAAPQRVGAAVRILVVQETDWIDRNPILHHRMLETLGLGGDEVQVLDYDIHWRARGRRPLLQRRRVVRGVTRFYPGSGVVVVRPAMLRLPAAARPSWLLMTAIELVASFRRCRPDVVVAYGISNAFIARLVAAWYRVPFVVHLFDSLHALAEPRYLAPIARIVERAILRSADAVIVVHRGLLGYVRWMGVRPSRVRLILNGFEVRNIDDARAAAMRRRLGVAEREVMILFVGWLYVHSGLREIARTLIADDRYAGYRLVVAGDGDLLAELRGLASSGAHGDRLVPLGRVPVAEIPELIAAADVGLHVSRSTPAMRDVVPAKVDEYLEVARPVIATRLPGMLLELGGLESIVWVDRPEDALDRLSDVLEGEPDSRAALRRLGSHARAYGQRREPWSVVTARFRSSLAESVAVSQRPARPELGAAQ